MMPWGLPNWPHGGERTAILTTERSSSRKKKDVVDTFISAGDKTQFYFKASVINIRQLLAGFLFVSPGKSFVLCDYMQCGSE